MTHRFLGTTLLGLIAMVGYGQPSTSQAADPGKQAGANVEQDDAVDPYGALRKRAHDLEKVWHDAEATANKAIATRVKDNPCSTQTVSLIATKRDAFNRYFDAEALYVGKQIEDSEKMQAAGEKAAADNGGAAVDYKAEISKAQKEVENDKAELAKIPQDNPDYKDALETLRENLKNAMDTLNNWEDVQRKVEAAANTMSAANVFVKARRQSAEEMKNNIRSIQVNILGTYAAEEETFKAKCYASHKIEK